MNPRHAREILLSWVRGEPRTSPSKHTPNREFDSCPLTPEQRHALYRLLSRREPGPAEVPPVKPQFLPPP